MPFSSSLSLSLSLFLPFLDSSTKLYSVRLFFLNTKFAIVSEIVLKSSGSSRVKISSSSSKRILADNPAVRFQWNQWTVIKTDTVHLSNERTRNGENDEDEETISDFRANCLLTFFFLSTADPRLLFGVQKLQTV